MNQSFVLAVQVRAILEMPGSCGGRTASLGNLDAPPRHRKPTSTSNFGVGRRESHDAGAFYARFEPPELSDDETVPPPEPVAEPFLWGDARRMDAVADGSVALVVTSPPYFAGKQYEEELDREGIPSSYLEYLQLLEDVFAECARTLEPGGRIAVNVANLGRKPYRSLAGDVMSILQDRLHLLPRGEVIWQKGEGASGSCAWGSYRSAANPVLRDVTERVVIASKGRFARAVRVADREKMGLPYESTLTSDEFMAATLDVWEIPPESARAINHPAPFPVALPARLVELYTYRDDLVLDPFMGSGSALVAAALLDRRYVGYDLDDTYVALARERVAVALREREASERATDRPDTAGPERGGPPRLPLPGLGPAVVGSAEELPASSEGFIDRAGSEGKTAQALAEDLLVEAGFVVTGRNASLRGTGATIAYIALDRKGAQWYFDVSGAFTTTKGGLHRTGTVWSSIGRAGVLAQKGYGPVVLLSSHLPNRPSKGDTALRAAGPRVVFDVVEMLSAEGLARLRRYAAGGAGRRPLPGFWMARDLRGR